MGVRAGEAWSYQQIAKLKECRGEQRKSSWWQAKAESAFQEIRDPYGRAEAKRRRRG
jgi:hypothetical protein